MLKYISWLEDVCAVLGWPPQSYLQSLMEDTTWYLCYEEALTPQEAVNDAVEDGAIVRNENGTYQIPDNS